MAYGLGRYGQNKHGVSQEYGAVLPGVSTVIAGPNPFLGAGALIAGSGTVEASSSIEGGTGSVTISATSFFAASGQYKPSSGGVMTSTGVFIGGGDIAWKGQTGSSITWTIQREHPNG